MNTLKKFVSTLCAIVLGISLAGVPAAAFVDVAYAETVDQLIMGGTHVVDADGLLSSADANSLESTAQAIESDSGVAAYFVTTPNLGDESSATAYAKALAAEYGLEDTSENGCVIMLVCLGENAYTLISLGAASDTFTEATLDYLDADVFPYLGRSDWAGAAETFFGGVSQTLDGHTANATSSVSYNGTYVIDDYGLFSDEQRAALEAKATSLAQQYGMGAYLLVVDYMDGYSSPTSAQRTNFATSFYRANDLGLGSGKDGIMLAIAVASRDYVTIAYGQGSYSFSDEGIDEMESAVTSYLGDNEWYDGCNAYYDAIGRQLEYYSVRGEPYTQPDLFSLVLKILATLGIPAGAAFVKVRSEENAMKTAREQTEASNYLVKDSFKLTHSQDSFVNTTMVVTARPKHEDSGGGSSFGGGGWGGGGGGGFSSSGGGKF